MKSNKKKNNWTKAYDFNSLIIRHLRIDKEYDKS